MRVLSLRVDDDIRNHLVANSRDSSRGLRASISSHSLAEQSEKNESISLKSRETALRRHSDKVKRNDEREAESSHVAVISAVWRLQ